MSLTQLGAVLLPMASLPGLLPSMASLPGLLLPVALAAAAAATATLPPTASSRLRQVLPVAGRDGRLSEVRPLPRDGEPDEGEGGLVRAAGPACVLGALALLIVVGGFVGAVLAGLLVLVGPRAVRRLTPEPGVLDDRAVETDLPLALDLMAACLAGGSGLQDAAHVVGRAVGGACGRRLGRVAAALSLGIPPDQAWSRLGTGERTAGTAARALARSAQGGTPVAADVALVAATAREAACAEATRRARRAGVLAVVPLGICFLPAFVLLGVVPAIIGLAAPLLAGL